MGCLLSDNGLGVGETILLDGRDVGIGSQNLQIGISEGSSESVDDVPLLCNRRLGADPAGNGGDTIRMDNVILECHDVTSSNSVLGLLDGDEGGGSSEDRENAENESDELLGEHGDWLELQNPGFNE